MHSVEDLELQQAIEEEEKFHPDIPVSQLTKFLFRMKQQLGTGKQQVQEGSSLTDCIDCGNHQDCALHRWLAETQ